MAGRALLTLGLLLGSAIAAQAQTALPDEAGTAALQCLQRLATPPKFPAQELNPSRSGIGYFRVKLVFSRPDRAPEVEVLSKSASDDMHDEVLEYLRSYRLPCMKPEFGPVTAVQEFVFDALASPEGKPLRLTEAALDAKSMSCLTGPREKVDMSGVKLDKGPALIVIEARFAGTSEQPPEVKIVVSDDAPPRLEARVLEYVSGYRMPCRVAGDKPYAFEQSFTFTYDGERRIGFKQRQMPLMQFLRVMKNVAAERVYFDLNSMSCPFQLEWTLWQPRRSNEIRQLGARNSNRTEFDAWLASLQMNLPFVQAKQMIGESLVIDVPCGVLDLKKPALPP